MPSTDEAWEAIALLFSEQGSCDYVGEPVSQAEHSLQAAKCAADATKSAAGQHAREEVVLAALLHDCGHMMGLRHKATTEWMGDCGAMHHERIGGDFVRGLGMSERVATLVQQHVNAKRVSRRPPSATSCPPRFAWPCACHLRAAHAIAAPLPPPRQYLTGSNPSYFAKLSPASTTTLGYQGGPFTPEECEAFLRDPDHKVILLMRTWDEAAKVAGLAVPPLESYREMVLRNVAAGAERE